jgi:hypothetical protein
LDLYGIDVSHFLVVEELGMFAEPLDETLDGVATELAQPGGGADAAAIGEMLGDGHEFVFAGSQAEQGSVGAFGEVRVAANAVQTANTMPTAGPAMQTQVASVALAIERAIGVGAGQVCVVLRAHHFPPFSTGFFHSTQPKTSREALRRHHHRFSLKRVIHDNKD